MVETQSKLYDLGKRTASPASITQSAPLPLSVELLGLPSSAELGVMRGSHTELGFSIVSPGEASVQMEKCWAVWLHCEEAKLPASSATTTLGRRSAHHLLQTCRHHSQQEAVWISPAKSQIAPISAVGRRESGSEWQHSKCETLRGYSLGPGPMLSPLLWARWASFPMGNSFALSP